MTDALPAGLARFVAFHRWTLAVGAVASIAALALRHDSLPLVNAVLAVAIVWIGLLPGLAYLAEPPETRSPLPVMALAGLFYAAFFGAPVFLTHLLIGTSIKYPTDPRILIFQNTFLDRINTEAQLLVLAGVVLMFAAWLAVRDKALARLPRLTLPEPGTGAGLRILGWGLALFNLAFLFVPALRTLPSIGQIAAPAGLAGFTIFYLLCARGRLPRVEAFAYFLGVLPLCAVRHLGNGLLTPILLVAVLWLVLRFQARGGIPWKALLVAGVVFVFIYPRVGQYRAEYLVSSARTTLPEKIAGFARIMAGDLRPSRIDVIFNRRRFIHFIWRVSLILPFCYVVQTTPKDVDYWDGATYRTLLVGWIPRALWRGKPEERWGNAFGRRYGILAPDERGMSVNIPWITELYANFGRLGVLVGMTLFGAFLGLLDRFLNGAARTIPEQATAVAVLLPLFYHESNFTVMTGSLLPLLVCFWLYFAAGLRIFGRTGS